MDAPEVARRTGAMLMGSEATANIGRGWGLPEEQIQVLSHRVPVQLGAFVITPIESRHFQFPDPAMRERGRGSILFSNNAASLRGRKRYTGQSLYYPRVGLRALAQALTEEYSEHGVHVANVVIDGLIDSPGTRALPMAQKRP